MPNYKAKLSVQLQDLLTDSDIFFDEKVTAMGWDEAEHYPEPIRTHLKAMVTEALDTLETEVRSEWGYNGDPSKMFDMSQLKAMLKVYTGHPNSADTHLANGSFALVINLTKIEII